MAALEYVHVPGYAALILRRDFQRLSLAGAIMDRSKAWLHNTAAKWNEQAKRWTFPSGAILQFGFIDHPDDRFRYASSEWQFIGWDELTEFRLSEDESNPYTFLFSRLRRTLELNVPLRVRAASNPGNIGHAWVKRRFITTDSSTAVERGVGGVFDGPDGRKFVPAAIRDNPALDADEYEAQLIHLPPVTRARLMRGNWDVVESLVIPADWLRRYDARGDLLEADDRRIDRRQCRRFATIDTAGTSKDKADAQKGKSASWSAVAIWDYWRAADLLFLRHIWRARVEWPDLRSAVRATLADWQCRSVRIENAHVGQALHSELATGGDVRLVGPVIPGMGERGQGAKLERAVASGLLLRLQRGGLLIPQSAPWLSDYEAELTSWSGLPDETADQIDVSSYAAYECKQGAGTWGGVIKAGGLER
jgi:phage terminase large subunit-like protein